LGKKKTSPKRGSDKNYEPESDHSSSCESDTEKPEAK